MSATIIRTARGGEHGKRTVALRRSRGFLHSEFATDGIESVWDDEGRCDGMGDGNIEVLVWRGTGGSGRFQSFSVPIRQSQTVLDVVSWIQQTADSTLSYRFACRVGMCGSCAMSVNGVPRWTCRTHVSRVVRGDRMTIAPLGNLTVIKDLVVSMDEFFDKWTAAGGVHHPTATRRDPAARISPDERGRVEANAGIECINCAVCYAACDTVAGSSDYLGPAALQRAWTQYNDSREADAPAILQAVSESGGCHNCHSQGSCARHCPIGLDPMRAISGLKRATVRAHFSGGT